QYSIVEYFDESEGYKCGYCKSKTTSYSQGMWAHSLNVEDYQALIDRGWRRSGCYCYKPTMNKTCCPLYTLRCDTQKFNLTKSKKKVAKRMRQFLVSGGQNDLDKWKTHCERSRNDEENPTTSEPKDPIPCGAEPSINLSKTSNSSIEIKEEPGQPGQPGQPGTSVPGSGPDPNKPLCKKAKAARAERKRDKLIKEGNLKLISSVFQEINKFINLKMMSIRKKIPDYPVKPTTRGYPNPPSQVRLIQSSPPSAEFLSTKTESHALYAKYQVAIHKDNPDDCTMKQWTRFLVDSPLNGPLKGYGSYHNQYWLDGKLVAVGVLDILPSCISSVYLYYDPDYGFLSFGVYSALSEISLVRRLTRTHPCLTHYYMGYYIQSCPKMRYKSAYKPSYLLCPESYEWVPIEKCEATLQESPYSRLNVLNGGSPDAQDEDGTVTSLDKVHCLYRRSITTYARYKSHKYGESNGKAESEDNHVREYVQLVGRSCAERMLLYR
uniref:Arginyl-tRNA--protein transferase 1 n=2 Tax=Ciona savignyi TaxID=51511 RepID=H2Y4K0_CIOSA